MSRCLRRLPSYGPLDYVRVYFAAMLYVNIVFMFIFLTLITRKVFQDMNNIAVFLFTPFSVALNLFTILVLHRMNGQAKKGTTKIPVLQFTGPVFDVFGGITYAIWCFFNTWNFSIRPVHGDQPTLPETFIGDLRCYLELITNWTMYSNPFCVFFLQAACCLDKAIHMVPKFAMTVRTDKYRKRSLYVIVMLFCLAYGIGGAGLVYLWSLKRNFVHVETSDIDAIWTVDRTNGFGWILGRPCELNPMIFWHEVMGYFAFAHSFALLPVTCALIFLLVTYRATVKRMKAARSSQSKGTEAQAVSESRLALVYVVDVIISFLAVLMTGLHYACWEYHNYLFANGYSDLTEPCKNVRRAVFFLQTLPFGVNALLYFGISASFRKQAANTIKEARDKVKGKLTKPSNATAKVTSSSK